MIFAMGRYDKYAHLWADGEPALYDWPDYAYRGCSPMDASRATLVGLSGKSFFSFDVSVAKKYAGSRGVVLKLDIAAADLDEELIEPDMNRGSDAFSYSGEISPGALSVVP